MPRLRQLRRSEVTPEVLATYTRFFGERDPVSQPGTSTGTPGNWWTVFALMPDIMAYFQAGSALMRSKSRIVTSYFIELGILRAAFARQSKFVFSQHVKAGRAAGIPENKIREIPVWSSSEVFDAKERALLAYIDEFALCDGRVQDATFERLKKHFKDEEILELTYFTGLYQLYAMISRALRLEYDDIDERIVEVPAPAGSAAAVDIMAAIGGEHAKK
jgi:alkylhydroperoxidase family enzyme